MVVVWENPGNERVKIKQLRYMMKTVVAFLCRRRDLNPHVVANTRT